MFSKNNCLAVAFFILLSLLWSSVYAAEIVNLRYQPTALSPVSPQSLASLPHASSAQNPFELQQVSKLIDANGNTHVRFQQTYQGYPVIGAEPFLHMTASGKMSQNGALIKNIQNDLQDMPSFIFTKQQNDKAIQSAMSHYLQESHLSPATKPLIQKAQLAIYLDPDHKAHWVFKVDLYFKNPVHDNPFYLLDAVTFKIYKKWNGMRFFEKVKGGGLGGNPVTGIIMYDGLPNHKPVLDMLRDSEKGICYLQNDTVIVKDGRKEPKSEDEWKISGDDSFHHTIPVLSFLCSEPNANHENIYWDDALDEVNSALSAGNDALYLAGQVNQMFLDWFHISVLSDPLLNDLSMPIYMVVHDQQGVRNFYDLKWWPAGDSTMGAESNVEIKLSEDNSSLRYRLKKHDYNYNDNINIVENSINSSEITNWNEWLPHLKDQNPDNLGFLNAYETRQQIFKLIISKGDLTAYDTSSFFDSEWDQEFQEAYFGDNEAYNPVTKHTTLASEVIPAGLAPLYPDVVPDIVAHELGHGFTQKHANLFLGNGPAAGVLYESFSDMTAKAFEYYLTGGKKTTWTIGAETGRALRYMDDPKKDCTFRKPCSIDHIKDLDVSNNDIDDHLIAGIFNKAFYLLATSSGWDTRKAFEVMVQANRYHWSSSMDFNETACGIWDAGNDLHLPPSDMNSITTAMAAVGLTANDPACHPVA